MTSAAEQAADRKARRAGWLLSAPALFLLIIAASGPLIIILI